MSLGDRSRLNTQPMLTIVKNKLIMLFQTIFIYLFLAVLGLCCCMGFSLVAASGDYSPGVLCRLLCCGAQALEHSGFMSVAAHGLQSTGPTAVAHRLSCSAVCGIFLEPGSNSCFLHWQVGSAPLSPQGSPDISLNHKTLGGIWSNSYQMQGTF